MRLRPPIPNAVNVGPYVFGVSIVTKKTILEKLKLRPHHLVDGMFENTAGEEKPNWYRMEQVGIIYINRNLSLKEQWRTLTHELQHAMTDLHDWDWEN